MFIFYIMAFVPIIVGAILWIIDKKVVWQEWAGGTALVLILAGIFHAISIYGMTDDTETWSGHVIEGTFYPQYVEEYQVAIYITVTHTNSNGSTYTTEEFSHYETRHRTHYKRWTVKSTVNGEFSVSEEKFKEISNNFGNNIETRRIYKSGFYSGDPNIYVAHNKTGYVCPVTDLRHFENRIKAAPSVFSYAKVPEDVPVFAYPGNKDIFESNRLLGISKSKINILAFDRINTELGPTKKVNLIIVGFQSNDSSLGQWQEAKWIGGKKNDLVICYGGTDNNKWTYCFGWTEQTIVKRNLETIFLNNKIDDSILPIVKEEVIKNYTIKDWSKFDYIKIEPPAWSYYVFIIFMFLTQGAFWYFAHVNEYTKESTIFKNRY